MWETGAGDTHLLTGSGILSYQGLADNTDRVTGPLVILACVLCIQFANYTLRPPNLLAAWTFHLQCNNDNILGFICIECSGLRAQPPKG